MKTTMTSLLIWSAGAGRQWQQVERFPLAVIMSQICRKRTASDRKPLGRFLSWTSDRPGIPEDGESEMKEDRGPSSGFATSAESKRDVGWGRVCVFLKRLGKKGDSRSLSLAHCDLTATDLLELATLLQFLPQVEEMDISWNELIGGSLTALTSHLQHVGEVKLSATSLLWKFLICPGTAALGAVVYKACWGTFTHH
ncbi:uncharacterized protein LOC109200770 isoform X4 [Oreochromis niloticus]|uniref:uncharacterized protein LOC109200770 isoform X4 n=1 Tax=Oreochromis niloticus TaxID=8128 RepID=UPI000DF351D2|nr:uncharacterized protein LOC109200770 isoform X4 [Oreochromis niloticus]XP_025760375.1 uncharacterized protein LOC109200770 isoform X4 [Oreochromis niloticus]